MSFFGFDTTLPRDRPAQAKQHGMEDIEVYTWGEERYDGLGDGLDEHGDNLNDDTFGGTALDALGTDFDFSSTPGFASSQPQPPQPASKAKTSTAGRNAAAFASSLEDLWAMPPFASSSTSSSTTAKVSQPQPQQQAPPSTTAAPRSLADIEAELLASRSKQQPPAQPGTATGPRQGAPLTLAEVEAQMLASRTPPQAHQQQQQQPPPPGTGGLARLPQAPPQPLPPAISAALQPGADGRQANVTAQQRAAAHIASMHALLNALPAHVRAAVLALPPNLHFEALQDVVRQFPALLAASRPGASTEPPSDLVQQDAVRYMLERAAKRIEHEERAEAKRRVRNAKIQSMSSHNNIMTNSDKDFITRIQVSQLVTNDPYSDDFYAHIYFAIRGNPNRPAAITGAGQATAGKPGGKRKVRQLTRRENAMLRMQQQVQRLVQNRKERMEQLLAASPKPASATPAGTAGTAATNDAKAKSDGTSTPTTVSASAAQTATLAGALGRISLGTAKNPKPMLALSPDALTSSAGMANDAVRQALRGASLTTDGGSIPASSLSEMQPIIGPDGKRAPLNRYQVLAILEKLYDLVMTLEQRRRDVPAPPTAPAADLKAAAAVAAASGGSSGAGAGDVPLDHASATAKWQAEQDALTATLWRELRVLEPLDISDPHPFVSLLNTVKGKRFLPRALRHLSAEQTLTVLTMVVASFQTLDVVRDAAALEALVASQPPLPGKAALEAIARARENVERQTEAFSGAIVPSMLSLMANAPLKIVSGMIALFVERNDVVQVARTRPGVAFLTIFLSRAETLKQSGNTSTAQPAAAGPEGSPPADTPPPTSPEDLKQWSEIFNLLFHRLSSPGVLASLFPSSRTTRSSDGSSLLPALSTPFHTATHDADANAIAIAEAGTDEDEAQQAHQVAADEPVWSLAAALAVSASMEQQQVLVAELREPILRNVFVAREAARRRRLRRVLGPGLAAGGVGVGVGVGGGAGEVGGGSGEDEVDASDGRIRNVNLLLHALNLDATQITV